MACPYVCVTELGRGSIGQVFAGIDLREPGRAITIKKVVIPPNSRKKVIQRIHNEIHILRILDDHPAILYLLDAVQVFDSEQNLYLLITEAIPNALELSKYPLDDPVSMFLAIGEGIKYIHDCGIAHRDLKPANILVCPDTEKPVIIDYDLACVVVSTTPSLRGTSTYLPLEILQSSPEADLYAADIFSFGVTCYRVLYRDFPYFSRRQLKTHGGVDLSSKIRFLIERLQEAELRSPPIGESDDLYQLIRWMIQVDSANRPTIDHVIQLLESLD